MASEATVAAVPAGAAEAAVAAVPAGAEPTAEPLVAEPAVAAGPDGAVGPAPAGAAEIAGGGDASPGPGTALEPIQPTVIISPAAVGTEGQDIPSPRDVLPDRQPTLVDLALYFTSVVFGSDLALKRFLKAFTYLVCTGVAACVVLWVCALTIHAVALRIAPGAAPSLGTVKWSVGWLTGGSALCWAGVRVRRWLKEHRRTPPAPTPAAGTAEPPAGESGGPRP